MQQQNYKNHARLVPGYHGVAYLAIIALIIGSFVNLYHSSHDNLYSASLICLASLVLALICFYARSFALKAQDRAIRAEENFRHYMLTNKLMDGRLNLSQVIALRFASDEEFPALAQKAAAEKLPAKEIKKQIQNWRGDYYRV